MHRSPPGFSSWKSHAVRNFITETLSKLKLPAVICIDCHHCEFNMDQAKPSKEKVREYMERRKIERRDSSLRPIHEIEQIRRELGWDLVERRKEDRREK
jgi:hypothetical protein